jgi:LysM repeat protein
MNMKKKTIQTKLSLLWVAVFIAVFLAGKSGLLPAWAAAQQQETSPTANANPFGLVLSREAADGSISHTVKEGEFLYPIAQAYGITFDELLALNGLTAESVIQPGQVLIIRRATSPQPALTSGTVLASTATLRPSLTPQPTLTPYVTLTPTITPTPGPGIFERVFTGNSSYVGYGLVALIVVGVILLAVSSRRIH